MFQNIFDAMFTFNFVMSVPLENEVLHQYVSKTWNQNKWPSWHRSSLVGVDSVEQQGGMFLFCCAFSILYFSATVKPTSALTHLVCTARDMFIYVWTEGIARSWRLGLAMRVSSSFVSILLAPQEVKMSILSGEDSDWVVAWGDQSGNIMVIISDWISRYVFLYSHIHIRPN